MSASPQGLFWFTQDPNKRTKPIAREGASVIGWTERSMEGPAGTVHFRERLKPGTDGVYERVYHDTFDRFSAGFGTAAVLSSPPAPVKTQRRARTRLWFTDDPKERGPRVVVSAAGRASLSELDLNDELENCGGVYGHVRDDGRIQAVEFCASASERGPYHARMDVEAIDRNEVDAKKKKRDLKLVGLWHTHPSGNAAPSPEDLSTWRSWVRCERQPFACVIFARRNRFEPWDRGSASRAFVFTPKPDGGEPEMNERRIVF